LDAIASSEDYAQKARSLGHPALAITEHGKMSSVHEHYMACKKHGIKPIFGVEAYVADELITMNDKGKRERTKAYHINLYAKNKVGYKNLLKLNYISMSDDDHFYYFNRVLLEEIYKHKEGLMITSGCANSPINFRIRQGDLDGAKKIFDRIYDEFGNDFYGEIQMNEFSKANSDDGMQEIINSYIIKWSKEKGMDIIITGDVHYLNPGEGQIQTLSIAIRNKQTINNLTFEIESKNLYYHDIEDYIKFNKEFSYNYNESDILEWAGNTVKFADKIEDNIIEERKRIFLPHMTEDDDREIIKIATKNLMQKFGKDKFNEIPKEYQDRLKLELEVINRKGFSSYMLLLEDVFNHVKEEGLFYGPARGCFLPQNKVLMNGGFYKEIKDVEVGDCVISGDGVKRKCLNRFEYEVDEDIVEIELENGDLIECTKDHKILTNGGWKEAKDLTNDDELVRVKLKPNEEAQQDGKESMQ